MANLGTNELVQSAVDGDPTALNLLVEKIRRRIVARVKLRLFDRGNVDDIVKLVLERVWKDLSKFDPHRGSMNAWVNTIVDFEVRHAKYVKPSAEQLMLSITSDSARFPPLPSRGHMVETIQHSDYFSTKPLTTKATEILLEMAAQYDDGRLAKDDLVQILQKLNARIHFEIVQDAFFSGVWVGSVISKIEETLEKNSKLVESLVEDFSRIESKARSIE